MPFISFCHPIFFKSRIKKLKDFSLKGKKANTRYCIGIHVPEAAKPTKRKPGLRG